MTIDSVLFWSSAAPEPVLESRLISVSTSSAITVNNLHIERCWTEKMFWFDASRSINVSGLFTTFSHNDVFHIQNNTKSVKILSWHSDATKNANKHDIVPALSNVRNIDIYPPILENSSLVERVLDIYDDGGSNPGVVRQLLTDNSTLPDLNSFPPILSLLTRTIRSRRQARSHNYRRSRRREH